jgi:DNA-binding transcriptional ArsR family regulator
MKLPVADYEADDVMVVSEHAQLRALADDLRAKLVGLLRERAASTTELAVQLALPKGTVGHHLKVLERAGLIRVVRTRKVRAVTEKYYGRVARLFVIKSSEALPEGERAVAATMLRQAADEVGPEAQEVALLHVRLSETEVRRLGRRLGKLTEDFRVRATPEGRMYGLVVGLYPMEAEEDA